HSVVTVVVLCVTVLNLFTVMWVERKLYSRLQDRYGIMISIWSLPFWPFNRVHRPTHKGLGYLQNLADGVKLIQKENITPRNADSAMFHISPVLIASSTLMVFAVLPWSSGFYVANLDLGILFILAAFSLAPLGFLIFSIAMIAEMERVPFDIPEAEAELVEGWTTEYSGMRFGIVFAFKWLRMLAACALISILYLGGWSGPVFATLSVGGIPVPI